MYACEHLSWIHIGCDPSYIYCIQYETAESCVTVRGRMCYLHIGFKRPLFWYLLVCVLWHTKTHWHIKVPQISQVALPKQIIPKSILFGFLLLNNGNIYWYYKDSRKKYSLSFFPPGEHMQLRDTEIIHIYKAKLSFRRRSTVCALKDFLCQVQWDGTGLETCSLIAASVWK